MTMGIRTAVMASLQAGKFVFNDYKKNGPVKRIKCLGTYLRYIMERPSTKRRFPVNVPDMVDRWIEAIVGMCLSHSKDEYDAHDAKADELLGPLFTAPVAQIREFYSALLKRMEDDNRVPMLVRMGYECWGEVMIKDAPNEKVIKLKNALAAEIAAIVEGPIKDQIPEAIKRALRWRDPETLKEIKEVLESGAKPKLVGRESCLYLECRKGKKKVSVML